MIIHRNITNTYYNLRKNERLKAHRFDIGNLDLPLLNNEDDRKTTGVTIDLPPDWMELAEDCNFAVKSIKNKVKELEKAQSMNLLNVFGRKSREEYERIGNLSRDISNSLKKIERNMELITTDSDNYIEFNLRNNTKHKIANELFPLSHSFRNLQKKFYDSLQAESDTHIPEIYNIETDIQDSVQIANDNIVDRTKRLQQIAITVEDLKELYTQLSSMIVEQGSMLDQIDYNVQQFASNSYKFKIELHNRYKSNSSPTALRVVRNLISVIFAEVCLENKFIHSSLVDFYRH